LESGVDTETVVSINFPVGAGTRSVKRLGIFTTGPKTSVAGPGRKIANGSGRKSEIAIKIKRKYLTNRGSGENLMRLS
jgi:hypothetical protein